MFKFLWRKSPLVNKVLYAALFLNFVVNILIFAADPNLHQFIHVGLWLLLCLLSMSADYYRLAYEEFESIRRFGADVGTRLHSYGTLFIEKDGDGYVITSFSDSDSEGDS